MLVQDQGIKLWGQVRYLQSWGATAFE